MRNATFKWMLFLLVILMVQMICQSVPLFRPRMGRGYRMKSVSVTKRLSMQLRSRLSMRPTNQRIIKLCSRNQNVYIQVRPNGVVNGTHDRNSKYTLLVEESVGISTVRLKGLMTKKYIAMNNRGKVYGTTLPNDDSIFVTNQGENYYHTFWSYTHGSGSRNWPLSVKKNGKIKRGSRARFGDKSTQFVVISDRSNL